LGKLFRRRTCWMLADLAQTLDYALISVRRLLKRIGYFRSYTHNGKWYTLRDSPQFNRDGIWHHKNIGFSKHGSLIATIAHLVARSPCGLSARDLAQKLQHPCHAVLTHLHQDQVLDRVKVAGEFRYLAPEEPINRRQREQAAISPLPRPLTSLSTQAAVWVLVEHIKNPGLSYEEIAARLQEQRQLALTPESIGRFFQAHDLKKTPAAPS
jgi:ribosome-binding protein aMBF1 (putative translation factor)